ncbi:hypothetical protein ACFYZE_35335 [Streptomyces sp. NPDC001796]|uniref:hypothetical protein n=1 Tax=Streptomyces sp. NPDC001796 TaxID=3364609 RepID=UPI0036AA8C6D
MRKQIRIGLGVTLAAASLYLAAPASAAEASPANPRTASGCTTNDDDSRTSCIDVEGHKLHVDRVVADESWGGSGHHCATPRLYANGRLFATGSNRCGTFSAEWVFPLNEEFSNNTHLCTSWSDEPSLRPCETVHD